MNKTRDEGKYFLACVANRVGQGTQVSHNRNVVFGLMRAPFWFRARPRTRGLKIRGYTPHRRYHGLKPVATNGIVPGGTTMWRVLWHPRVKPRGYKPYRPWRECDGARARAPINAHRVDTTPRF
jgi:hypothetical protein